MRTEEQEKDGGRGGAQDKNERGKEGRRRGGGVKAFAQGRTEIY